MIPKKIFTIWISDKPLPEKYHKACKTHAIKGYTEKYITLKDCRALAKRFSYVREAIAAKKYIKVTDFARMYYLYKEGGIYLDCDMEVLKPFDALLRSDMFVGRENKNTIANSIIGAKKGHSLLKKYLQLVEENFKGGGEMIFEPAERLFTDLIMGQYGKFGKIAIHPSEYFFPLNERGRGKVTKNSYTYHYFSRSWKP